MKKEIFNEESLRSELLSEPVLKTILEEVQVEVEQNPVLAEKLVWMGLVIILGCW